jgi:hypothetical protein
MQVPNEADQPASGAAREEPMEERDDVDLDGTASRRLRRRDDWGPPPPPVVQHPVKDIALPLAMVLGLVANAWWAGDGWGRVNTKLDQLIQTQAATVEIVTGLEKDVLDLKARMRGQQEELRLFKAYTKGRIARMPYRASDDGE